MNYALLEFTDEFDRIIKKYDPIRPFLGEIILIII